MSQSQTFGKFQKLAVIAMISLTIILSIVFGNTIVGFSKPSQEGSCISCHTPAGEPGAAPLTITVNTTYVEVQPASAFYLEVSASGGEPDHMMVKFPIDASVADNSLFTYSPRLIYDADDGNVDGSVSPTTVSITSPETQALYTIRVFAATSTYDSYSKTATYADVSVNVTAPPTPPSLSTVITSPAEGEQIDEGTTFTVEATVTNTGGSMAIDVNATITLTGPLSLAAGETSTKTLGNIGEGNYVMVSWQVNADEVEADTSASIEVSTAPYPSSDTVAVTIKNVAAPPVSYDLTISVSPTEGGTTDPPPGVHTYTEGTLVDVTAIPNESYVLDHWELDGSNVGAANPTSVTMNMNHTLVAVFTYSPPPPSEASAQLKGVGRKPGSILPNNEVLLKAHVRNLGIVDVDFYVEFVIKDPNMNEVDRVSTTPTVEYAGDGPLWVSTPWHVPAGSGAGTYTVEATLYYKAVGTTEYITGNTLTLTFKVRG